MSKPDVERLRDMAALREAARREAEDNARHPRRSFRIETELVTYRAAVDALTPDDWQALARLAESRPSDGLAVALDVESARAVIATWTPEVREAFRAALAEGDSAAKGPE
jgi:hypothetical protein